MVSGVRVIDGLLTCGVGQRVGIFSSAGCGKTTLMNMLISHAEADAAQGGLDAATGGAGNAEDQVGANRIRHLGKDR